MLTIRLNKLIGQLNGVKKMIEDGVACEDVLTQINAVNGGLHKLSFLMLDAHVRHCVREGLANGWAASSSRASWGYWCHAPGFRRSWGAAAADAAFCRTNYHLRSRLRHFKSEAVRTSVRNSARAPLSSSPSSLTARLRSAS